MSVPTPCRSRGDGAVSEMSSVSIRSISANLRVERFDPASQVADHRVGGEHNGVGVGSGPLVCCLRDQSRLIPVFETDPDRFWCCEHQMTKLVECLDTLLAGRTTSHQQDPDLFNSTIPWRRSVGKRWREQLHSNRHRHCLPTRDRRDFRVLFRSEFSNLRREQLLGRQQPGSNRSSGGVRC